MKFRMNLRRWLIWLIGVGVVVAALCLGLLYYHLNYISIGGDVISRDTQTLDLRGRNSLDLGNIAQLKALKELDIRDTGINSQDYSQLQSALSDCNIRWSVPLSGGAVDSDSESIALAVLADSDLDLVQYLPELAVIDASACEDYPQLLALQHQYPDLKISYDVKLGGQSFPRDAASVTLDTVDPAELAEMLPHFANLAVVELTGSQPDDDALFSLMKEYPGVNISWDMDIFGVTVNSLASEVDVSGVQVQDLEALEAAVLRLPNLEKVIMCGCGISNEEMDALNRRHDDVKFVWSVTIRGVSLRTDLTELMPYKYNLWPSTEEAQLFRYLTDLECLDLGHHKITNCDFVAYMPNMKYLLLGDTRINDLTPLEDLTQIIYLEIFLTHVTDYTPLLNLKNLQDLNLCYTKGQVEVIAQLTWVDYIRWITTDERMLYKSERELLEESLPDTLLELGTHQSSTGGQWRQTQNYFDMRDILGMGYMTG